MAGEPSGERDLREVPEPVDVRGALREAIDRLASIEGQRALIGGVALAIHGIERFTKDVDLAVTVQQAGAIEAAGGVADLRPLKIGGVSFATSSGVRVDLIDRRFEYRALFEEAIAVAQREGPSATVGDRRIPVVTLPHLVAMKLAAGRPKDESDLAAILAQSALDYARARQIVKQHLGDFAARYLDRLARTAGRDDMPEDYADTAPYVR